MFEPMSGSAPKYTGKNVINPMATICAGGMMMDTLGEPDGRAGRRQLFRLTPRDGRMKVGATTWLT